MRPPPRRPAPVLLVPARLVLRILVIVLLLAAAIVLIASGVVQRAASGTTVADAGAVVDQQAAAARDIGRGYDQSAEQVKKARALKLAIGTEQADAIATKALGDLFTLRHSALVSLAQTTGGSAAAAETYATTAEKAMDAARGAPVASSTPVLLAPRLYAIVSRFNQLATSISDQATTALTASPTPAPTVRPTPTPTR